MAYDKRPSHAVSFRTIRSLTEEALRAAKYSLITDAVNWANLRVVSVEFYENDAEEFGYRVSIAEASPTANVFQAFIKSYLEAKSLTGVEVLTEW